MSRSVSAGPHVAGSVCPRCQLPLEGLVTVGSTYCPSCFSEVFGGSDGSSESDAKAWNRPLLAGIMFFVVGFVLWTAAAVR